MKSTTQTRLGSILFSTMCVVAFGFLAGPVMKPASGGGIEFHEAARTESSHLNVSVAAGKSIIVESSARIIQASVENPDLARAVSIDDHEVLLNGKTPGRTNVTVWQEGGGERRFDLHIEREQDQSGLPAANATQGGGPALTGAYQDAMARVQTVITGVNR